MSYLVFDIETIPDPALPKELRPEVALGNLKDKDKIALKVQDWEENGQVKKMSVSPLMNKIVSIQMWSSLTKDYIDTGGDEIDLLVDLDDEVIKHDVIVGHGIHDFDIPTVIARSMMNRVPSAICNMKNKRYSNFPFYDTMQVLSGWDASQWKSLDWCCKRVGIKGKSGSGGDVYKWWQEGKQEKIDAYCREDVRAQRELYEYVREYYK